MPLRKNCLQKSSIFHTNFTFPCNYINNVTNLKKTLPMKKAFLIASALLLQLSSFSLAAQALPEQKAVGKAATYYRHLDLAASRSRNSVNEQVAQNVKKPAPEAQVATKPQIQPAVNLQSEMNKAESTQASTAK
jgi:hypothetical protein